MTLKRPELEILLNKDNPTKVEMLVAVARGLKKSRQGLYVDEECLDRCGGCGRVKKNPQQIKLPNGITTQETFCEECAEKWKAGF